MLNVLLVLNFLAKRHPSARAVATVAASRARKAGLLLLCSSECQSAYVSRRASTSGAAACSPLRACWWCGCCEGRHSFDASNEKEEDDDDDDDDSDDEDDAFDDGSAAWAAVVVALLAASFSALLVPA